MQLESPEQAGEEVAETNRYKSGIIVRYGEFDAACFLQQV